MINSYMYFINNEFFQMYSSFYIHKKISQLHYQLQLMKIFLMRLLIDLICSDVLVT